MNDVKIDVKNRTISFGDFIKFYDVPEYVINYINQLQSNWNSLREELYQANRELVPNELVNGKELINNILDKMNELESSDNK